MAEYTQREKVKIEGILDYAEILYFNLEIQGKKPNIEKLKTTQTETRKFKGKKKPFISKEIKRKIKMTARAMLLAGYTAGTSYVTLKLNSIYEEYKHKKEQKINVKENNQKLYKPFSE